MYALSVEKSNDTEVLVTKTNWVIVGSGWKLLQIHMRWTDDNKFIKRKSPKRYQKKDNYFISVFKPPVGPVSKKERSDVFFFF